MLEAAPTGLPVFTLTLDDRLSRMMALTQVPYVAAVGPGQFDKMTSEGDDALTSIPDLIDRACGWLGTCG